MPVPLTSQPEREQKERINESGLITMGRLACIMCPADDKLQLREFQGTGQGLFVSEFMSFPGLVDAGRTGGIYYRSDGRPFWGCYCC